MKSAPSPRRWIAPAIITAFVAVAVVIGLTPRGPKGNFIQSSEFQLVMENLNSGEQRPLPGRMMVSTIASFRSESGAYCRSYRLIGSIEGTGLVCRRDGEWQSEARSDSRDSEGVLKAARERLGLTPMTASEELDMMAIDGQERSTLTSSPRT